MRRFWLGAAILICPPLFGGFAANLADAALIEITVNQTLVDVDGNDYSKLKATVGMEFDSSADVLTVVLRNISGVTTGPTANANAGNILTGLGFNLPDGVDILGDDSSVFLNGSSVFHKGKELIPGTASFGQNDWGYSNSARGHLLTYPGVEAVDTVLSALAGDASATFGGKNKSKLHGIDYGLQSAIGNVGPGGLVLIEDEVLFTLALSGLDADFDVLNFIEGESVVAVFGSPAVHTPEPASFIIWFLIGLSWAGSAWRCQYRRRWKKWQQEEAAAAAGSHGDDQAARLPGSPGEVESQLDDQSAGSAATG